MYESLSLKDPSKSNLLPFIHHNRTFSPPAASYHSIFSLPFSQPCQPPKSQHQIHLSKHIMKQIKHKCVCHYFKETPTLYLVVKKEVEENKPNQEGFLVL